MDTNLLPKELEESYEKHENYFDWWNIQLKDDNTVFYIMGKCAFQIQGKLEPEKIIEQMNNYEWIYSNAFKAGVKSNQEKIKIALGLN